MVMMMVELQTMLLTLRLPLRSQLQMVHHVQLGDGLKAGHWFGIGLVYTSIDLRNLDL